MKRPFLIVNNGRKTIPKSVVIPDGEIRRPIASEKAVADFTLVCDETGILDQAKRLKDAQDRGDIDGMMKVLRED